MSSAERGEPSLRQEIERYTKRDIYPFHMPGHKRQTEGMAPLLSELYAYDLTEVPGTDDLHAPEEGGMLSAAQERAARLYGAKQSFFLINGSTAGVLIAISAALRRGGTLLLQRASHRSAYAAAELRGLRLHYLKGERTAEGCSAGVRQSEVAAAFEAAPKIEAVFLTSPSYEGYSGEPRSIAAYLHERGIPLIVDAAHGAHFGLAEGLPESAVSAGADLVVMSLHKTLPAPTQTALLHIGKNALVDAERVRHYNDIYQSSSPSYPLMAAIDDCIGRVSAWREDGGRIWQAWYERRRRLSEALRGLTHLRIVDAYTDGTPRPEPGKLLIVPRDGWSGLRLAEALRQRYRLQPEMALPRYVLCICTVMDTEEGERRLAEALRELDADAAFWQERDAERSVFDGERGAERSVFDGERDAERSVFDRGRAEERESLPEAVCTIAEAAEQPAERVRLEAAAGRISAGYLMLYPPGQPLLVPGERVTEELLRELERLRALGCEIRGVTAGEVAVLREDAG